MVSHAAPHTVGSAPHAPSPARVEPLPPARLELAPSAPRPLPERQRVRRADRSAHAALHDQPASATPCAWPSSRYRYGSPAAARPAPRLDPDGCRDMLGPVIGISDAVHASAQGTAMNRHSIRDGRGPGTDSASAFGDRREDTGQRSRGRAIHAPGPGADGEAAPGWDSGDAVTGSSSTRCCQSTRRRRCAARSTSQRRGRRPVLTPAETRALLERPPASPGRSTCVSRPLTTTPGTRRAAPAPTFSETSASAARVAAFAACRRTRPLVVVHASAVARPVDRRPEVDGPTAGTTRPARPAGPASGPPRSR